MVPDNYKVTLNTMLTLLASKVRGSKYLPTPFA